MHTNILPLALVVHTVIVIGNTDSILLLLLLLVQAKITINNIRPLWYKLKNTSYRLGCLLFLFSLARETALDNLN